MGGRRSNMLDRLMDVLTDLLTRAHARGALFAHTALPAPWGLSFPDATPLAFHAVLEGEAWLRRDDDPGGAWRRVGAGEVALVRSPSAHALASAPDGPTTPLDVVIDRWRVAPRRYVKPGARPEPQLFCGAYGFEGSICTALLGALPPVVHLERPSAALTAVLGLMRAELEADAAGSQTVLDRLLDSALVFALREHAARSSTPAVVRGLTDPEVRRALELLHAEPARAWTVASLAGQVGLSRAALARRFAALVGQPPLAYLTGLRMAIVEDRLRTSDRKLAAIAAEVGYGSEFALSAAFKRAHGVAPGAWRREQRAGASVAA